jgi:hypothetical protein
MTFLERHTMVKAAIYWLQNEYKLSKLWIIYIVELIILLMKPGQWHRKNIIINFGYYFILY